MKVEAKMESLMKPVDSLMYSNPFLPAKKIAVMGCDLQALCTDTHQVSILRLDVAGFTECLDTYPLYQVVNTLKIYLDQLTQLVYEHGGAVNKYLGDGFLAVFTDANAAVQAGYAIQHSVANFNRYCLIRSGILFPSRLAIDTGQVAITTLRRPGHGEQTIIGMPINLADRLQAKATPGRVWFTQATFDRLGDRSDCYCLGPINVKGRQEPVIVYEKR